MSTPIRTINENLQEDSLDIDLWTKDLDFMQDLDKFPIRSSQNLGYSVTFESCLGDGQTDLEKNFVLRSKYTDVLVPDKMPFSETGLDISLIQQIDEIPVYLGLMNNREFTRMQENRGSEMHGFSESVSPFIKYTFVKEKETPAFGYGVNFDFRNTQRSYQSRLKYPAFTYSIDKGIIGADHNIVSDVTDFDCDVLHFGFFKEFVSGRTTFSFSGVFMVDGKPRAIVNDRVASLMSNYGTSGYIRSIAFSSQPKKTITTIGGVMYVPNKYDRQYGDYKISEWSKNENISAKSHVKLLQRVNPMLEHFVGLSKLVGKRNAILSQS